MALYQYMMEEFYSENISLNFYKEVATVGKALEKETFDHTINVNSGLFESERISDARGMYKSQADKITVGSMYVKQIDPETVKSIIRKAGFNPCEDKNAITKTYRKRLPGKDGWVYAYVAIVGTQCAKIQFRYESAWLK